MSLEHQQQKRPEPTVGYKVSFPSIQAFTSLIKLVSNQKQQVDCVAINVMTLIRNIHADDPKLNATELAFRVNSEAKQLIQEVSDSVRYKVKDGVLSKPYLIFYLAEYGTVIPLENRRIAPDASKDILVAAYRLQSKMREGEPEHSETDAVHIMQVRFNGKVAPFRRLANIIASIKNRHEVALLSHVEMDFHLVTFFPSMQVIQSFNGTCIKKAGLSEKVFGDDELPFIPDLHVLLGDKTYIKSPLSRKQKTDLYDLAERENWVLKTNAFIRESLDTHNLKPPYQL